MIKAIVFDLGGVVFTSDGGSYETREKLAEDLGIDVESLHNVWFKYKNDLVKGKMSEQAYLESVIENIELNETLDELKKIIRDYNIIDDSMVELLLDLKNKYHLFALTNDIKEWIEYRINNFKLNHYFEKIISSCDVGMQKPDLDIYEHLLKEIQFKPEEVIFIDNREENLAPAEKLGIKTHHFKSKQELELWLQSEKII